MTPEQDVQQMLVARVLQGEHEAIAELVKQYSSLMLRVASLILGVGKYSQEAPSRGLEQFTPRAADR